MDSFKENYCKNICFLSEYIGGNVYLYSAGFYITYITNKSFFFHPFYRMYRMKQTLLVKQSLR